MGRDPLAEHYVRLSRWLPQRYHEVPRKYRWSCLQMTLRSPLVGACAGRYPPSRRRHKRLPSHRWTYRPIRGDGGDDANALESSACLHVDHGYPRQSGLDARCRRLRRSQSIESAGWLTRAFRACWPKVAVMATSIGQAAGRAAAHGALVITSCAIPIRSPPTKPPSSDQPLGRQPAADAGPISGLPCPGHPQHRRGHREL